MRYVQIEVKPRYDNGDVLTFNLDLSDEYDEQLFKLFASQKRIVKVEKRRPKNNEF